MIKDYDPNFRGVHVVRVTFMQWDYVGHVAYAIGGNCRGSDLLSGDFLETDIQEDIDRYPENDCDFTFHEAGEFYSATLRNSKGDTLEVDGDENEFKAMVVSIEFSELKEAPNE